MSFLSPQDFATQYGLKYGTLRSHISRGKVVKKDNLIDTDHPVNRLYIQENAKNSAEPPKKTTYEEIKKEGNPPKTDTSQSKEGNEDIHSSNLTLRKKRAEAEKSERQAEKLKIEIQKLQGKLMPMELVEKTQTINIQSIFRTFESAAENIASIYNERLGGDRATLAEMTTRMRTELARAINSAKEKSKEEITGLMKDYADTMSRGEKK
ncbi:MAG TPA: hypothetical protein VFM70_04385 [Salinimicrobium sp.]|nr:hypothetical protein [Salinimicrobium sp.]